MWMVASTPAEGNSRNCRTGCPQGQPPDGGGRRANAVCEHPGDQGGYRAGRGQHHARTKGGLDKGVTDLLFDVMRKPPNTTFVVIEEVELENWGVGGLPAEDYRRLQQQEKAGDV
jgi:4-oxalocrotonate tautomerase